MNLQGKVVLLTGASRGLGKELAHLLDRKGCSLYLVARSSPGLDSVKATLKNPATIIPCDLSVLVQRCKLLEYLKETVEQIDILINCAGVGSHSRLPLMTIDEVESIMQLNALAPLELMVGLRSQLAKDGLIVNIGSVAGEMRLPSVSLYAASKAAMHSFTQSVSLEGARTLLVILGAMCGTDFVNYIAYPRQEIPAWYRRLDIPVETAGRQIVHAMERGRTRLVLPRWYPIIFIFSRLFAPVIKSLSFTGGRHVQV